MDGDGRVAMPFLLLTFAVCTAAIVLAGGGLSKYSDILAEKTGIGRVWIGMTAVAISTSLPELATGISAIVYAGSPNIALGDALGSCVFNMLIIALVDIMTPQEPMQVKLGPGNLLTAGFSILIIGTVLVGLLTQQLTSLSFLHMSLFSLLVIGVYTASSRLIFVFEKREMTKLIKEAAEMQHYREVPMSKVVYMLAICAVTVALAGTLLPVIGVRLSDTLGLGRGFVGNALIAFSTSLPEVVVAVTAVRMGSLDIAVGNVFGSNLFNCVVLAVDDAFYTKGPLFADAAPGQAITAGIAIMMASVALVGLIYKARHKSFMSIGWDSVALIGLYALNLVTSYSFSGGH
jgi:cation:H+ antiporter